MGKVGMFLNKNKYINYRVKRIRIGEKSYNRCMDKVLRGENNLSFFRGKKKIKCWVKYIGIKFVYY